MERGGKKPKCRMGFTSYKMPHHHPNETDRLYTHTYTHRVSAVLIKDSRHALELPPRHVVLSPVSLADHIFPRLPSVCVCAIITIESFASTQILFSFLSRHFFVLVDKLAHDVMRFLSEKQQKRPKFMPVEWMKFLISALFINYCLNCGGGLVGGERRGETTRGPRLPLASVRDARP